MKSQVWFCEKCGVIGAIMFLENSDVMSVVHMMGNQHRQAAPGCQESEYRLRSIHPEYIQSSVVLLSPKFCGGSR